MGRLFGTDGVRGIANTELTPELAFKLAYYGAQLLSKGSDIRVVLGKDTRLSCDMLENAICAGLCSAGADVYLAGIIPTPAIAYITANNSFDCGIMISASHNSYEFNGIKFFDDKGYKLADSLEDEIEDLVSREKSLFFARPQGNKLGRVYDFPQAADLYLRYLRYTLGHDLSSFKIAMDCANGAGYHIAPRLFKELGAELHLIACEPDGCNINKNCGSTHLQNLVATVLEHKCDLGIAYDGDADRLQAVDRDGKIIDGDVILALLAKYLQIKDDLRNDSMVITVMSNLGLHEFCAKHNIKLEITNVGDRYVLERMKNKNLVLGGEQSGHIILKKYATTGDGILSSLILLKALKTMNLDLTQASSWVEIYPQVLKAGRVDNDKKSYVLSHPQLEEKIYNFKEKLGHKGRILVRASGTEPLIRVMIEGNNLVEIEKMCDDLIDCINNIE